MKQITIQIPEKKVPFMMELLQNFDFVKINTPLIGKGFTLTKSQKESVEIERAKSKKDPNYLLDWDSVKNTLKID
jgi:hypothetical protein